MCFSISSHLPQQLIIFSGHDITTHITTMPTGCKRLVQFNPSVTGIVIMSLHDYTPSEIAAAWYDNEEMDEITKRCVKILKKMESNPFKNSKYCLRGLEGHSTLGSINKRMNRSAAAAAVLDEQARQWRNERDGTDTQAIADAYRKTTSSCQMWAQVMGNRDQLTAEEFLNREDDNCNENVKGFPTKLPNKSMGLIHVCPEQRRQVQVRRKIAC